MHGAIETCITWYHLNVGCLLLRSWPAHKYDEISGMVYFSALWESHSIVPLDCVSQNHLEHDGKQYLRLFQRQVAPCPQKTQHSASH